VATSPPTTLQGYVSYGHGWYGDMFAELLETVPDLFWPLSVRTYAQMRRDPQLAAILAAYTLPIRRASWTVDGTGCKATVTRLVADDLGLPVAGKDKPAAARTRGVSWPEHLRAALRHLTFGHAGFELEADVSTGKARLSGVYERPQHTISRIFADPHSGEFLGITQDLGNVVGPAPDIKAANMAWYVHEREGAAWQGNSMLRPAFAAWLIKREMQRVLATSNRRFGMGVPVMEALPGTVPTPGQMGEAQRFASAVRVGDQAGATSPPGFSLKLIGLSGSTPDTLAFIKWLDHQMATMALAGVLDLGQTSHGARALGDTFIELMLLGIQTIADEVADTATRELAARIVAWNWGDNEPVPSIKAPDVGAKREVTSEALNLLLTSGALSADPGLEAWVRREYRLPEREGPPLPMPGVPGAALPGDAGLGLPESQTAAVTATKRARQPRKAQARGQLALPVAAATLDRKPTDVELQAGVDVAAIDQQWQTHADQLAAGWGATAQPMVDELVTAVTAAVAAGTLADLIGSGGLATSAPVLAGLSATIGAALLGLASEAADEVVAEADRQGVAITAGTVDAAAIAAQGDAAAAIIAAGYAGGAAKLALAQAGPGTPADAVGTAVRTHLDAITATAVANEAAARGWVVGNLGSALTAAQATGRLATFTANEDRLIHLIASERLDGSECQPCHDIDATVFDTIDEAVAAYPAGRYHACLGMDRCRGLLLALWSG
jgi:hypothetical protein